MAMSRRRLFLFIFIFLLLFFLFFWWSTREDRFTSSSVDKSPSGLSFARTLLEKKGWMTISWEQPLPLLYDYPRPAIFVAVNPRDIFSYRIEETTRLRVQKKYALKDKLLKKWVAQGNDAIVLLPTLEIDTSIPRNLADHVLRDFDAYYYVPNVQRPRIHSFFSIFTFSKPTKLEFQDESEPVVYTTELYEKFQSIFPDTASHTLMTAHADPVLFVKKVGSGRVIYGYTSSWVQNRFLRDARYENAVVWLALFQTLDPWHEKHILFDEFHHGFLDSAFAEEYPVEVPHVDQVYALLMVYALFLFLFMLVLFSQREGPVRVPETPKAQLAPVFLKQIATVMKKNRMREDAFEIITRYVQVFERSHARMLSQSNEIMEWERDKERILQTNKLEEAVQLVWKWLHRVQTWH